jgi:hypothetical protein
MFFRKFADNTNPDSHASKLRRQRMRMFLEMVRSVRKEGVVNVLDVGGTEELWRHVDLEAERLHVTILNTQKVGSNNPRIDVEMGDARTMTQFKDKQFDVVFSNSVIEHLGTFEDQQRMANEVRRTGRAYFIQTPNFFFPVEPHFVSPIVHWLPVSFRVFLLRRMRLGWYQRRPDRQDAERLVREFRLLRARELRALFPEAVIRRERFAGLSKSLIAVSIPHVNEL